MIADLDIDSAASHSDIKAFVDHLKELCKHVFRASTALNSTFHTTQTLEWLISSGFGVYNTLTKPMLSIMAI